MSSKLYTDEEVAKFRAWCGSPEGQSRLHIDNTHTWLATLDAERAKRGEAEHCLEMARAAREEWRRRAEAMARSAAEAECPMCRSVDPAVMNQARWEVDGVPHGGKCIHPFHDQPDEAAPRHEAQEGGDPACDCNHGNPRWDEDGCCVTCGADVPAAHEPAATAPRDEAQEGGEGLAGLAYLRDRIAYDNEVGEYVIRETVGDDIMTEDPRVVIQAALDEGARAAQGRKMPSERFRERALRCVYLRRAYELIASGKDPLEVLEETALDLSDGLESARDHAVDAEKRALPRRLLGEDKP